MAHVGYRYVHFSNGLAITTSLLGLGPIIFSQHKYVHGRRQQGVEDEGVTISAKRVTAHFQKPSDWQIADKNGERTSKCHLFQRPFGYMRTKKKHEFIAVYECTK